MVYWSHHKSNPSVKHMMKSALQGCFSPLPPFIFPLMFMFDTCCGRVFLTLWCPLGWPPPRPSPAAAGVGRGPASRTPPPPHGPHHEFAEERAHSENAILWLIKATRLSTRLSKWMLSWIWVLGLYYCVVVSSKLFTILISIYTYQALKENNWIWLTNYKTSSTMTTGTPFLILYITQYFILILLVFI